ncbi:hypothetical protein BASA81_013808, partial [Batrachochytrium salamandrivorans]
MSELLSRVAELESKGEAERIETLTELVEVLDPNDGKEEQNKIQSESVLDNSRMVDLIITLSATTSSVDVATPALRVLDRLAFDEDNARGLLQRCPRLIQVLMTELTPGVEIPEQVQVAALDVLSNLALNEGNAREMVTKHATLFSLLAAKADSESEQVQVAALNVLYNLALNEGNAREMVTKHATLFSLLAAKADSESEQVQVAALNVLYNLALNKGNAREMVTKHATLFSLLAAKADSESEQVQVAALNVLYNLALNEGNAREMVTKHATLFSLLAAKADSELEQVQVAALDVLSNLAWNEGNVREMVIKHATLLSLLVANVGSKSKQVQVKALEVLCYLALNGENAREMVTEHATLFPLVVANVGSKSKQVQVAALEVLSSLVWNSGNVREMVIKHATLLSLLVANVGSKSKQVQVKALEVLCYLASNSDNAREMVTEHATLVSLVVAKVESESKHVQIGALGMLQKLAQNSGNKQKMMTLLVAKLGTDNPEQVQVALNVLQSLANKDKNAREMVIEHATLVPLLMAKLYFAASPTTTTDAAPLMFPVFSQALVDASAELDVVLKFRLLVEKVKVSTQRVIDKDALMGQNCGDGRVLEGIQGLKSTKFNLTQFGGLFAPPPTSQQWDWIEKRNLESMKLNLTQFETQLGSEPFFAPPTSQQLDWIEKRNLARSNLLSSRMRLEQAISATGAAHLAEFNALKQQLGEAINDLDSFLQCTNTPGLFSPDSVCLEASKSSAIEVKQRELLHVFQVKLVQGINDASPCSTIDRMTTCYLELILLCKMRTREELDNMLQQAREVLQSQGVLRWTKKRLESSNEFISQNKELQAKLERANEIIDETRKLRGQFVNLEIEIDEHNLLRKKALLKGQAVARIERKLATLDATRKSIIFIKGELDKEMRHLVSKQVALEENVVCHFPELFHRVALEWEATPVGQALSKADEIKALLLKSDLLLSQGVAEYAGPTARMELTMNNVQSFAVRGAVANGSGTQVVIKRVVIKDSLTEIAKTKRILRASRIAAHPSILSCLGGIVVSEQEVNLVFPYMCGGDLAFWSQEQVRPASRKVDVLTQVSDAIVALHRVNIFHRDIKPWNIVMDSSRDDAVPKLTDFDMSKETGIAQTFNTTRGLLGTTQGFRAPEVGSKVFFSATDYEKQDVYSFGATAMWLLGDKSAHSALFARCTKDDANLRPTSKEVYGIL